MIVIERNHRPVFAHARLIEDRIRTNRSNHINAAASGLQDCRLDAHQLLIAKQAMLPAMGIEAGYGEAQAQVEGRTAFGDPVTGDYGFKEAVLGDGIACLPQ